MLKMPTLEVQNRSSKNLKLYILSTIKDKNKLPDDVKKNVASYHLKPFLVNKLVEKKGYGTWEFTKLGKKYLTLKELQINNLVGLLQPTPFRKKKEKIRGHGFRWRLQLPAKCHLTIKQRNKVCKKFNPVVTGNKTVKFMYRHHNIHLCQETILIHFDKEISYYGNSAKESYKEALFEFEKVVKKLESLYSTSFKIRGRYKFQVPKQHYGELNNEFAVHYKRKNQSIRVFDNGKEWLNIDFSSKQFIETETTDASRAKYDMDAVIQPFMNELRHNPKILTDHQLKLIEAEKRLLKAEELLIKQSSLIEALANKTDGSFNKFIN
ncbi:MAG: hypothetical protein ACOCV1_06775 [Bacillota bacterium]